MSIVADQVRRVDSQLDRLQLLPPQSSTSSPVLSYRNLASNSSSNHLESDDAPETLIKSSQRIEDLQAIIKSFSSTSSHPLLSSYRISHLLSLAALHDSETATEDGHTITTASKPKTPYEKELEWLLISKATVQTYGLLLHTLIEETIPLQDEQWYWDEVAGSWSTSVLYMAQMMPVKSWHFAKEIYGDASDRFAQMRTRDRQAGEGGFGKGMGLAKDGWASNTAKEAGQGVIEGWKEFYGLVRESIAERSMADIQTRVLSPLAKSRSEVRRKQAGLRRLREMSASGLGVLMDEGLSFPVRDTDSEVLSPDDSNIRGMDTHEWKSVVERSVALMDSVLRNVTRMDSGIAEFEDGVFAAVEDDPEISMRGMGDANLRPAKLAKRLMSILGRHIPEHINEQRKLRAQYGRPGVLVRYWLPATALLLSSTTILRILVNRKAELLQWLREFGQTVRDFWGNWVVEPSKKVIKTIRHDEGSEVAIMSKESLAGDRDSLERMVVDFVRDNTGTMDSAQLAELKDKIRSGDLTPVLKAYEKDLAKPFVGAIKGDLVRTLLIQVQKTKVDVEVAMSGIDALLKSQELVFGFIGLTPGILVTFAVSRWLSGIVGGRKGRKYGKQKGRSVRVLRNVDRLLAQANNGERNGGCLGYKDHGLLLCEVEILRKEAMPVIKQKGMEREFLEDVAELADVRRGVEAQRQVVRRIRWVYGKALGL